MPQVRINVRSAVNASKIRRETRNGRDYIVVPSATLPDNIVMNGIKYPADEIAKGYQSLENTPAPLGHPNIAGAFVSASDPEGLTRGWVGAWNRNVRRENGRVFVEKVIDVQTASQLEGGKRLLNAIEKGEPIHTSTGLYARMEACSDDSGAKHIARDIVFDHDAILLDEDGAATPEQGVGMLVNKATDAGGEEVEVVNSSLDDAERELDWAVDMAARAMERIERAPMLERIKSAIKTALGTTERETSNNTQENEMTATKEQLDALSGKVDALSDVIKGLGAQVGDAVANAMKPLTDQLKANAEADAAKAATELEELRTKAVNAKLIDEDGAKELTANAAKALLKAHEASAPAKKAFALNGAGLQTNKAQGGFALPKAEG